MSDLSPLEPTPPQPAPASGTHRILPLIATPDPSGQTTDPHQIEESPSSARKKLPETDGPLADYELIKELGRGGMGVVYKARQKSLDRLVAVKMLLGDPAHNSTVLARFLTEARSAAGLRHPNIVAVYQIGEFSGGHFFVMEYIKGPTLQSVIERPRPEPSIPVLWAVNLMLPVIEAVHYAHTRGIIHRDLKPANIMIDKATNRPVVLDFGIARRMDEPAGLTRMGVVIGTPSYMPPEQANDQGAIGPASDVYSLGAILYRCLTGQLPYEAETALATLLLVAGPAMAPTVNELRPDVPAALSAICMKALSKRPEDRFQTAAEFGRALKKFLATPVPAAAPAPLAVSAPAAAPPPALPEPSVPTVILSSEATGERFQLTRPVNVIGRGSDCDMVIKKSDVSKRHCRILIGAEGAEVEDLDSVNGTTVNGDPVSRQSLMDGDLLEIVDYAFRVKLLLPPKK